MIDGLRRGIELAGGTAVAVDLGPPIAFAYSMTPQRPTIIPVATPVSLTFGQLSVTVVFTSVDEQITPGAPAPAPGGAAAPSQIALPTLRRGAGIRPQPPNPDVRVLQGKLGIDADGQFGGGTEKAVKAFQRSKGLDDDGVVGPKTWTALFATQRA
jgi:peptidoglycan hydrolase-like protein with peptidoglycan-binding domain